MYKKAIFVIKLTQFSYENVHFGISGSTINDYHS